MKANDKSKRDELLKDYVDLRTSLDRDVRMSDLIENGYSKDTVSHYYQSLKNMDAVARKKFPACFHDVSIDEIYSEKYVKNVESEIRKHKRFVVTTAVAGCKVDDSFYKAIKSYAKKKDAKLIVLLAADPASVAGWTIDKKLGSEALVLRDIKLNSNVFLSTIRMSAKHIDPITGLDRIGQRDGSFIFASPKQRLQYVATSNIKLPHALMTTGAITKPNYATARYMSERTAYIADSDHVMGALILEIENDVEYHFRQIQADKNGSFIDYGVRYSSTGKTEKVVPTLVLGDWHAGSTDDLVKKTLPVMCKETGAKTIVLHDAFDGLSINHHEEGARILKAQRAKKNQLNLEAELCVLASDLDWMAGFADEIVIVKSNHDEFLSKHYLQKAQYVEDPENHHISLKLALAMLEGRDPLKEGVELVGLKNRKKVCWLKRDEDYKIANIQLGSHGDKGSNGSKGTLRAMEKAYGNSVSGHSHTPGILRGAWQVGTSSYLKLSYNEGPSSWMQTHCLVYPDGSRQLINLINGKWKLKD